MKKNRRLFPDKLNTKHVCCLFLLAFGCWLNLWNNCFAKPAETPLAVTPIQVNPNQLVLKGSELCPKSLMAINTQLSPSGMFWFGVLKHPHQMKNTCKAN